MGTQRILTPKAGQQNGNGNVPATREQSAAAPGSQRTNGGVEIVERALASSQALKEFVRGDSERARFAIIARNFYRDRLNDKDDKTRDAWAAVDPNSYALACLDAARDGLVPDGRQGYMIPRGKSADWQPSWKGLLILARRHNDSIDDIAIEIVYRQEIESGCFRADLTTRRLEHIPWYSSPDALALLKKDDDGLTIPPSEEDIAACYCVATIRKNGKETRPFRVLSVHELLKRADASGPRNSNTWSNAWKLWFESMARAKTFKAWCDWNDVSDDLLDVIARDDERERGRVEQVHAATVATAAPKSLAEKVRGKSEPAAIAAPAEPEPEASREPGDDPDEPHDAETGEVADAHA